MKRFAFGSKERAYKYIQSPHKKNSDISFTASNILKLYQYFWRFGVFYSPSILPTFQSCIFSSFSYSRFLLSFILFRYYTKKYGHKINRSKSSVIIRKLPHFSLLHVHQWLHFHRKCRSSRSRYKRRNFWSLFNILLSFSDVQRTSTVIIRQPSMVPIDRGTKIFKFLPHYSHNLQTLDRKCMGL